MSDSAESAESTEPINDNPSSEAVDEVASSSSTEEAAVSENAEPTPSNHEEGEGEGEHHSAPSVVISPPTPKNEEPASTPSTDSSSSTSSSSSSSASLLSAPAPTIPDDQLTPDQLRGKKTFERWQKTFLGAIDKQTEEYVIGMLKEGEDLVNAGFIDLNKSIKITSGSTFLHTACWFQKRKIAEWLLEHGANPNQVNLTGNSPLHLLCEKSNQEGAPALIQLVVDYGGDLELKETGKEGALTASEKAKIVGFDTSIISLTKQKEYLARKANKAAAATQNQSGDSSSLPPLSPEEQSVAEDKAKLVYKKLTTLFLGLDAEGVSQAVDDAIVRILTSNLPLIHRNILDINKPPQANDGILKTFLHYAVIARRGQIVKVLLQGKANTDAQDEAGDTPLHIAVDKIEEGNEGVGFEIVAQLLDAGANTTIPNYLRSLTPLQMLPADADSTTREWLENYKPNLKESLSSSAFTDKVLTAKSSSESSSSSSTAETLAPAIPSAAAIMAPATMAVTADKIQDKQGARALLARMATNVLNQNNLNVPNQSGSSSIGAASLASSSSLSSSSSSGPSSSALNLFQKAAGGASALPTVSSVKRSSDFSSLQQLLAAKTGLGGGVAASVMGAAIGQVRAGAGAAAVTALKKLLVNEKQLNMEAIWNALDQNASGVLHPLTLLSYHSELHQCGTSCTINMVHQVLESVLPVGQCTRANFLDVLGALELLCNETQQLRWEMRALDVEGMGSLSADYGSVVALSSAELLFAVHGRDDMLSNAPGGASTSLPPSTSKFDDFISRKIKQEKVKPKEIKYWELQQEFVGKIPTL